MGAVGIFIHKLLMHFRFLIMDSSMNCLLVILQTSQTVPMRVLP